MPVQTKILIQIIYRSPQQLQRIQLLNIKPHQTCLRIQTQIIYHSPQQLQRIQLLNITPHQTCLRIQGTKGAGNANNVLHLKFRLFKKLSVIPHLIKTLLPGATKKHQHPHQHCSPHQRTKGVANANDVLHLIFRLFKKFVILHRIKALVPGATKKHLHPHQHCSPQLLPVTHPLYLQEQGIRWSAKLMNTAMLKNMLGLSVSQIPLQQLKTKGAYKEQTCHYKEIQSQMHQKLKRQFVKWYHSLLRPIPQHLMEPCIYLHLPVKQKLRRPKS